MKPLQFSVKDSVLVIAIFVLGWGWFVESHSRVVPTLWVETLRLTARKFRLEREIKDLEEGIADMERSSRVTKKRMEELEAEFYKIRNKVAQSEQPSSK